MITSDSIGKTLKQKHRRNPNKLNIVLGCLLVPVLGGLVYGLWPARPALETKMRFVQSYWPESNLREKVEVYVFNGVLNESEIREFCEYSGRRTNADIYLCVVFDHEISVVRSTTPITTAYDLQERAQQHIRMKFFVNKLNGYSAVEYSERGSVFDSAKWLKL